MPVLTTVKRKTFSSNIYIYFSPTAKAINFNIMVSHTYIVVAEVFIYIFFDNVLNYCCFSCYFYSLLPATAVVNVLKLMLMYIRMLFLLFLYFFVVCSCCFSFLRALIKMCVNSLRKTFFLYICICEYLFNIYFYKLIINTFVHTFSVSIQAFKRTH